MPEDKSKDIEGTIEMWDKRATNYDEYYETLEGAIEHEIDCQLLKEHLPRDGKTRILDAAGGTGRITLLLAKMGYPVTLCDISSAMLNRARQKLLKGGVLNKVDIVECDVRKLQFDDESFDFVLCWGGTLDALRELIRVTKKGGKISIFLVNKCRAAINKFREDPNSALSILRSRYSYIYDDKEKHITVSVEDASELFKNERIKVIEIYAVCGMLEFFSIPEDVRKSRTWDDKLFRQLTEMLLKLSKDPSTKGLSKHLVLYGEKVQEEKR
jgi:ubiquinone/menaquinone biosynthesis C-methylase UbiE